MPPDAALWAGSGWRVLDTQSEVLAVHAALLPSGLVLMFSGDETDRLLHDLSDYDHTRLFDPDSSTVLRCSSPTTDVFCCGHAMAADGQLVVAGGIADGDVADFFLVGGSGLHAHHAPGSRAAWTFRSPERGWVRLQDMTLGPLADNVSPTDAGDRGGRWYPTLITLSSGEVLAMSGHPAKADARHNNNTPEILTASASSTDSWILMPPIGDEDLDPAHTYPRLHALPDGRVFSVTPFDASDNSCVYDPVSGTLTHICALPSDPGDPVNAARVQRVYLGYHCSSVLLPFRVADGYRARVLITNGRQPHVVELDDGSPTWQPTAPRSLAGSPSRWNATAILLPTGEVLVTGGVELTPGPDGPQVRDENAVLQPEVFDPLSGVWTTLPAGQVARNYHSVAVLLPDGRVFTGGSNANAFLGEAFVEKRMEILTPWYAQPDVSRPWIVNAPPEFSPGEAVTVQVGSAIARVVLLRTGSVTHCYNSDQRLVELDFSTNGAGDLVVSMPADPRILVPGTYLIFVIDVAGVPSKGRFVHVRRVPHWSRWARLSEAGKTDPSSTVSAVSTVPGGVSLFLTDREGAIQTAFFDPRLANPTWSPWARLSEAGKTDPSSTVSAVSTVPGGVSLFLTDREGAIQTAFFDPRV